MTCVSIPLGIDKHSICITLWLQFSSLEGRITIGLEMANMDIH